MDLSGLFLSTHLDRFWYFVPECDISSNQSLFQRSRKRPFTQPMVSDRCNEWPHSQRFLQASLPAFLLFGFFPVCLMQRFFHSLESSCRSAVWYSLCSALVSAAAGQSKDLSPEVSSVADTHARHTGYIEKSCNDRAFEVEGTEEWLGWVKRCSSGKGVGSTGQRRF